MEVPRDGYQQLFIYLYWLEDMGFRSDSYVATGTYYSVTPLC